MQLTKIYKANSGITPLDQHETERTMTPWETHLKFYLMKALRKSRLMLKDIVLTVIQEDWIL